ncbi:MAG TPA: hypothetical protein PKD10_03750 [Paracoccaceae bacterium]|nr:hypothetical protein [Paracoccaceae bacterium]HMO72355.1 hypothetical protein [Paracoccaceae bacterium]
MPRFVIDLGDIDMPAETVQAINADLQKTALSHLTGLKFERPIAVRFPREWLGLIARLDLDRIQFAEKEILAGIGDVRMGRMK